MKTLKLELTDDQARLITVVLDNDFAARKVINDPGDRYLMYPVMAQLSGFLDWTPGGSPEPAESKPEPKAEKPKPVSDESTAEPAKAVAEAIEEKPISAGADASYGDETPGVLYDSAGNKHDVMLLPGHIADLEEDGCTAFDFGAGKVQAYPAPPKQPAAEQAKAKVAETGEPTTAEIAAIVKAGGGELVAAESEAEPAVRQLDESQAWKHEPTGLTISLSEKAQQLVREDALKKATKWKTEDIMNVYLHSLKGLTPAEIEGATGVPKNSVGSLLTGNSRANMFDVLQELRANYQQ